MDVKKIVVTFLAMLLLATSTKPLPLPLDIAKSDITSNKIRIVVADETVARQKILDNLKAELASIDVKVKDTFEKYQRKTNDIKQQLDLLKKENAHSRFASENLVKKTAQLAKLNQLVHDCKDIQRHIHEVIKQHVEFWEKYFSQNTKTGNTIDEKSLYSFIDLQKITKKIALDEEKKAELLLKKDEAQIMVHRYEHLVNGKDRDIRHIEKEIEDLKKQQTDFRNLKGEIDLLDLEKEVSYKERELAELRIEFHQKEQDLCESKILVLQENLKTLREHMTTMRSRVHIDKAEIFVFEHRSNEQRREASLQKTKLAEQKNKLLAEKMAATEKLETLGNRYPNNAANIAGIQNWDLETTSLTDMHATYALALEQTTIDLTDRLLQKNQLETLLCDAKIEHAQILYDTVHALYGITQGSFKDNDFLEKERKTLKELKLAIATDIKREKEEIATVHGLIKDHYKAFANVKKQQERLKSSSTRIASAKKADESFQILTTTVQNLENQKDISLQISDLYAKLLDIKEENLENINFMLQELELVGVWHRAIQAVTWDGIKDIIPNLKLFFKNAYDAVYTYAYHVSFSNSMHACRGITFVDIFGLMLRLLMLLLLFLLLRYILPSMHSTLISTDIKQRSLYIFNCYVAVFLNVIIVLFNQLCFWITFACIASWYHFPVAIMLLFFTYSILFWIYALHICMQQFFTTNRRSGFALLSKRLINRFHFVFSFFFIATIVILFFRRMFMLVMTYQQSEFPNILLRIYHIVIFIAIILSIDKEEVLGWIPSQTKFEQKILAFIERYYYVLLGIILSLLIMSDPYLGGYGSLIWHIFWTSLFTLLTLVFLFFLHKFVGRYSKILFFHEDALAETNIERFENARTWYGLYVVMLFFLFLGIAIMVSCNLWGYGLNLRMFKSVLLYELPWQIESWGKIVSLRIIDLVRFTLCIIAGFLSAYLTRKFILDKIFEIHYVDSGVQNTITIISRYAIIFISILIGFTQAGLGNIVTYILGFGILALAWAFKDLFTDFFAYFFILVQRPLKLGDYVKVDDNVLGVVRKISPRAVILRSRNAVNIVVPNSTVLKASLYNWNYTKTYIGFDDIFFAVPFGTDIVLVKEIVFKILDNDPDILKMPQPIVRLESFSNKGYEFMVRGFLSSGNTLRQWDVASNIRCALVIQLAKHNIPIAAPALVLINERKTEIIE